MVGGSVNGLGAVRALAAHGVPVAVVATRSQDIAQVSRFTRESLRLPELHSRPDSLVELLERHARRWKGWAVLPTNDHALVALARNAERLRRWYPPVVPPWEVTVRVVDKQLTYAAARQAGIETPASHGPASRAAATDRRLRFPVVVKPVEGHLFWERFGKKLFVARDAVELLLAVDRVEAAGLRAEVFDCVPGGDDSIYQYAVYMDRRGEPAAEFALRKLRQAPPHYGVARAAETAAVPELREPTIELLRRLEWRGIAAVEYKRDARDGRYRLLEVNGRCFLAHGLARRAGVNLPLLAWREHVAGGRVRAAGNGWDGVWLHLHGDILYTAAGLGSERLDWRAFLQSYARPKTFAVWSRRDPAPFLAQWATTARRVLPLLRDREERAGVRSRFQALPGRPAESREAGGVVPGPDAGPDPTGAEGPESAPALARTS